MIRAFVAIELPAEVRAAVGEAQDRLQRARVGVRVSWAKLANLHLTLQFLGDVAEAQLADIQAALALVAEAHAPLMVAVHGAGAFPVGRAPRVLWVGCRDEEGRLQALAAAVQGALQPLGFASEQREFAAHLTLGRVRVPRADAALTKALDCIKDADFGTWRIERFHLLRSELHPEGSIYTTLSSHALTRR